MPQSNTWKAFERWVAKLFESERNPLSGGNGKHSRSDSLHPDLFISCKHTRSGHNPLFKLVTEETEKAVVEKKVPVIVIGRSGRGCGNKEDNTLVVFPIKYLKEFSNAISPKEEETPSEAPECPQNVPEAKDDKTPTETKEVVRRRPPVPHKRW